MFEIIVVIIAAYGVTNIVTQGTIFDPFKEWIKGFSIVGDRLFYLLNCPMCFGFWVGLFLGLFFGPFVWWNFILNGAFYSAACWLLHCLSRYLGSGQDPEINVNVNFPEGVPHYRINNEEVNNEELKETN
jgi:hypothetical protein